MGKLSEHRNAYSIGIVLAIGVLLSFIGRSAYAATSATVRLEPINAQGDTYQTTPTSITVRCRVTPNGDTGQYSAAYKFPSDTQYSLTSTKTDFPTTTATFTEDVTINGLTPNTQYDVRCRIRANATTVNSTTTVRVTTPSDLVPGVTLSKDSLQVSEAGTADSLTAVLTAQPATDVTLIVSSSDVSEGVVTPASVVFTSANWNTPQTISLAGVDDAIYDGTQLYTVVVAVDTAISDPLYHSVVDKQISANTIDDESAPTSAVKILAAGDVCDTVPSPGILCTNTGNYIRDKLSANQLDYVLELGDMQYSTSNRSDLDSSYATMQGWGGFAHKTIPVVGNHEQSTAATKFSVGGKNYPDGYCRYFDASNTNVDGYGPMSTLVNPGCYPYNKNITSVNDSEYGRGDLSFRIDLGNWSIISMESTNNVSSDQVQQLNRLLDAAGNDHVMLAVHHPYWASYCANPSDTQAALDAGQTPPHCHGGQSKPISGTTKGVKKYWDVALERGVDIIATAHDHKYERYVAMDTTGVNATGIPQFLSGLGGAHPDPGCSERQVGSAFCVGKVDETDPLSSAGNSLDQNGQKYSLTSGLWAISLKDDGTYAWEFVDTSTYPTSVRSLDIGFGTPRP